MLGQLHSVTTLEHDDGSRAEDLFRRAAFSFASAAKKLADSSVGLGSNTKVAYAALVDIEYARDALDNLFMPKVSKAPADATDRATSLTAQSVRESVSGLAERISSSSLRVVPEPEDVAAPQSHRGIDLGAPVYPKAGKMLWAGIDCSVCPSKASQRCQRNDGSSMEKPHSQRKVQAEAMASVSATSGPDAPKEFDS